VSAEDGDRAELLVIKECAVVELELLVINLEEQAQVVGRKRAVLAHDPVDTIQVLRPDVPQRLDAANVGPDDADAGLLQSGDRLELALLGRLDSLLLERGLLGLRRGGGGGAAADRVRAGAAKDPRAVGVRGCVLQ